ncbi:MAG: type VI secretion system ImpA family N-terminal domain-containing protein [Gammaproteobacteria bacterium]
MDMQIEDSALLRPISPESPCGADLEDTQLLASFDAYRLFGQSAPLPPETDWREIRERALEALQTSKDFRLLAHFAAAAVRTDGFAFFAKAAAAAAHWLQTWNAEAFPRVDEDAILRRNALNALADRMGVVDGVRRAPLLVHRQIGSFSIRDIEIATGVFTPPQGEEGVADVVRLNALLAATALEELRGLCAQLDESVRSLNSIEESLRSQGGVQAAPDFALLLTPLSRTLKLVKDHVATRAPVEGAAAGDANSEGAAGIALGNGIRNRDDATRALDAVASFFRTSEPSSPIPLLIERAKRLVAKDFLAVLQELAPDCLAQAKAASGVRDRND